MNFIKCAVFIVLVSTSIGVTVFAGEINKENIENGALEMLHEEFHRIFQRIESMINGQASSIHEEGACWELSDKKNLVDSGKKKALPEERIVDFVEANAYRLAQEKKAMAILEHEIRNKNLSFKQYQTLLGLFSVIYYPRHIILENVALSSFNILFKEEINHIGEVHQAAVFVPDQTLPFSIIEKWRLVDWKKHKIAMKDLHLMSLAEVAVSRKDVRNPHPFLSQVRNDFSVGTYLRKKFDKYYSRQQPTPLITGRSLKLLGLGDYNIERHNGGQKRKGTITVKIMGDQKRRKMESSSLSLITTETL